MPGGLPSRTLRVTKSAMIGVGVVGWLAFASASAQAAVRSARAAGDPLTTYTIRGRTLEIRSTDPVLLQVVRGSHLLVFCYPASNRSIGTNGVGRWSQRSSSVTVRLRANISGDIGYCETTGTLPGFLYSSEFSRADFTARLRRRFASTPPPGRLFADLQLAGDWMGVHELLPLRFLTREGTVTSFPPAQTLVEMMKRPFSKAGVRLLYAPDLADVTEPGVPYLVGQGSSSKRLEFAIVGLDGTLYLLKGRAGNYIGDQFGPADRRR